MTPIPSLEALATFAEQFVKQQPAVVLLSGPLGAGKTAFVRASIAALAVRAGVAVPRVKSPSFVIHQRYLLGQTGVEHFDFYRLQNLSSGDLVELGYPEAVERCSAGTGWVFVEWPERVSNLKDLKATHHLEFQMKGIRGVSRLLVPKGAGAI